MTKIKHIKSIPKSTHLKDVILEIENHNYLAIFTVMHGLPY